VAGTNENIMKIFKDKNGIGTYSKDSLAKEGGTFGLNINKVVRPHVIPMKEHVLTTLRNS
jgi:hypothetical protein